MLRAFYCPHHKWPMLTDQNHKRKYRVSIYLVDHIASVFYGLLINSASFMYEVLYTVWSLWVSICLISNENFVSSFWRLVAIPCLSFTFSRFFILPTFFLSLLSFLFCYFMFPSIFFSSMFVGLVCCYISFLFIIYCIVLMWFCQLCGPLLLYLSFSCHSAFEHAS